MPTKNNYKGPRLQYLPMKPAIKDGILLPSFADDKTRAKIEKQMPSYIKQYKEDEEDKKRYQQFLENQRQYVHDIAERKRKQREKFFGDIDAYKAKMAKKLEEDRAAQKVHEEAEFQDWAHSDKKEMGTVHSILEKHENDNALTHLGHDTYDFFAKRFFDLKNQIGSTINGTLETRKEEYSGKSTIAGIKMAESDAHLKLQQLQNSINEANRQADLYREIYAPKPDDTEEQRNQSKLQLQNKLNDINKSIEQLKQQMNDPQLLELDNEYKVDYVLDNGGLLKAATGVAVDFVKGLSLLDSDSQKNRERLAKIRRDQMVSEYDQMTSDYSNTLSNPENRQKFNETLNQASHGIIYDSNALKRNIENIYNIRKQLTKSDINYLDNKQKLDNSVKMATRYRKEQEALKEQYKKDEDETVLLQDKLNKMFPVAKSYEEGQQLYQNEGLLDINYWKYVMPNMIGSSNSSKDQMIANAIQFGGTVVGLALAKPTGGASLAMINAATVISAPWQVKGGVAENHTEIGTKRAEALGQAVKSLYGPFEKNPIIEDLKNQSIKYWKSKGVSDEYIKDHYDSGNDDADLTNIMRDFNIGYTRNNDPRLQKIYFETQKGLKAQFQADNLRTMGELPVQFAQQFIPTGPIKKVSSIGLEHIATSGYRDALKKLAARKTTKDVADRYLRMYGERLNSKGSKFVNGFNTVRAKMSDGFGTGAELFDMAGFGYGGHIIGGLVGSVAKPLFKLGANAMTPYARASFADFGQAIMRKYQMIYDKLLPKDWMRLAYKYGINAANRGIRSAFSEGAEEGVQYLNSKEDFASQYGFRTPNISELLANDWAQGSKVASAYAALLGLSKSELMDDEEFWQNVKGGFALGFAQPAVMNFVGSVPNAIRQYNADKALTQNIIMTREANNMDRSANSDFAKQAMNGNGEYLLNAVAELYEQDKRRSDDDKQYSQEEYDEKLKAIKSINGLVANKTVRGILEAKGFKFGTNEYANAIADIYNNQDSLIENQKQTREHSSKIESLYQDKEFTDAVQSTLDEAQNNDVGVQNSIKKAQDQAEQEVETKLYKEAKENGEQVKSKKFQKKLYDAKKEAREQAKQEWIDNARQGIIMQTRLANRLKALLKIKQQCKTLEDIYLSISDFGIKTKKPDSKFISDEIDRQTKEIEEQLQQLDDSIDFGKTVDDAINAVDGLSFLVKAHSEEIQQSDSALAMLQADRKLTNSVLEMFEYGVVKNKDGKYQYNVAQYNKEKDHGQRLLRAKRNGDDELVKKIESEDTSVEYKEGLEKSDAYRSRIKSIANAAERNARLNWMVQDIYNGDAVLTYTENAKKEREIALKKAKNAEIKYKPKTEDPLTETKNSKPAQTNTTQQQNTNTTSENTQQTPTSQPKVEGSTKFEQTKQKRQDTFAANNEKYQRLKNRAKQKYEARKKRYKDWKRGNLNATILPFQDSIVAISNQLMKQAEIGAYKIQQFIDDVKEIAEDVDIKDYIPQLKQNYIKNSVKLLLKHPELENNISSSDEVISYGLDLKPEYIRPEEQPSNPIQNILDKDAEKIDNNVSSYYDVVVQTENGPIVCTNNEAIEKLRPEQKNEIEDIKQQLISVKDSDEKLLQVLEALFKNTPVQYEQYIKYKNIDGIFDAIARNAVSYPVTSSIRDGILVRNAVIATLLNRESELNPNEYPSEFDIFIKRCQQLRKSLKDAGYTIITTAQNIYDPLTKTCEQADIILTNNKGEIRVIDVLSSYSTIRNRWDYRPGGNAYYTIHERETDILHSLRTILQSKLNKPVDYLGVLPVIIDRRHNLLELENVGGKIKFIEVEVENETKDSKYGDLSDEEYNRQLSSKLEVLNRLVFEYNDKLSEYQKLVKQAQKYNIQVQYNGTVIENKDILTIEDCDSQIENTFNLVDELNQNYNDLIKKLNDVKQESKRESQLNEYAEYYSDYVRGLDDISQEQLDKIALLGNACSELDMLVTSFVPVTPKTQEDRTLIKKIYQAVFDAQNALNDILSDPNTSNINVSQEEELIASTMEKLVENRENFGQMCMFVQKWWITDLATVNDENFISYFNKIKSWSLTLRDHVMNDLDNRPKLQAWYNSILNNYFSILLKNAQKFCDKIEDPVQKTQLQNAINYANNLLYDFNLGWSDKEDTAFPAPAKDEVEKINRMPHQFRDKYNVSSVHPLSWSAMQINGHYYQMSTQPDFIEKALFDLRISDKQSTYTNPQGKEHYTIKPGDLVVYISYTDKQGKKHWADIPLLIDESYFTNASLEDLERMRRINRGQRKFTKRFQKMLDYVKAHPEYKIETKFSTNKGSIKYDHLGLYHNVTDFVFKGYGNEPDLYTIKSSASSRLGISVFKINKDQTISYDVYAGDNLSQRIGGFDEEFDKKQLRINSGQIIYFYYTGNNKYIGIPIVGNTIGKETAVKLVDILYSFARGEQTYEGYDTYSLLNQFLYILDPRNPKTLNEFNKTGNLVSIVNGSVIIGNQSFDLATQKQSLIDKISNMSIVINAENINQNFNNSDNILYSQIKSQFQMNGSLNQLQLPNGLIIDRQDITHQNNDGTVGSTFLGYMFRHNMLVTKAIGKNYTQLNIQSCELVKKNDINTQDPISAVKQAEQQERKEAINKQNSLLSKFLGGITFKQTEKPESSSRWSEETEDDIIRFFDEVLGDLAKNGKTLSLEDDTCLSQIDNQYIMGVCHALSIELSKYSPKSAAYHEAFHKIFELLIPEKTRDTLYQKYRDRHKGVSDRQIAEAFADMFMIYMTNRRDSDKSKWYKRLHSQFRKIGITLGILKKIGFSGTRSLYQVFNNVTNGKYRNATISDKQKERFDKLFEGGLNYTITDNKTNTKINFEHLNDTSDVSDMVRALGFYVSKAFKLDDINAKVIKLINGKQFVDLFSKEFIDALCGNGLDETTLTESQRAFREVFETKDEYIYKEGTNTPIGKKKTYPKLDILIPKINDYIKESITSYSGKIEDQDEADEDEHVMNSNIDKFDRPSYEFSKLDSIPESTKFFFATVPYLIYGDDGSLQWDLSRNKFYSPTFMPIQEVYNLMVNEFGKISTPAQLDEALAKKVNVKPMYKYIYDKFHALYTTVYKHNDDGSITVDYNKESYMIQIVNTIHSMKHTYIFGQSKKLNDGSKQVSIKESSLDRDSRQFSQQWTTFLLSGQVSVFNRNKDANGNLTFCEGAGGKNGSDIFNKTADFLQNIRNWIVSTDDDLTLDGVVYNKNVYSDIDQLKSAIIDKLNRIGIIFTKDALDYLLSTNYDNVGYEGLQSLFTDRGVTQMSTFIDLLHSFVNNDGVINQKNVSQGYIKNGFVKELGNKQGAYNRITINNMAQGLGGKRYFSISQNNTVSTIVDAINTNDKNNSILHTLTNFGYNVTVENGITKGSIILQKLMSGGKNALRVYTYLGLKTDNKNDTGTEYKKESQIDDYVTKMAMLQQGILIFPTLADKGTWMCLDGVKLPGMEFTETVDEYGNKTQTVKNVPTIMWIGSTPYIRPSDNVLNQMLQYADCERLAIQQCMEDLGYKNIPGYEKQGRPLLPKEAYIKNYHTPNDEIEPNGTRFLSLTELVVPTLDKNGNPTTKTICLNDTRKSSVDMLKLANDEFFNKPLAERQQIMALTLNYQYQQEVKKALELGIIERKPISVNRNGKEEYLPGTDPSAESLLNLSNINLNSNQIDAVAKQILNSIEGWKNMPIGPEKTARMKCCNSLAIAAILADASTRSIMSSQETLRCFIGHPAMFKVQYDNVNHRIKDSTFDIQKRIGSIVSTGEDNMTDIPLMSKTYRCAECKDYKVSSTSNVASRLDDMFKESQCRETFAIAVCDAIDELYKDDIDVIITFINKASKNNDIEAVDEYKQQRKELEEEIKELKQNVWKASYDNEKSLDKLLSNDEIKQLVEGIDEHQIKKINKAIERAKSLAQTFSDSYKSDINVADGASYITAQMCEDLLRMRGQLTDKVKEAFDLLTGDKQYSWTTIQDAYKTVYEAVNIVTTKYTAYGFRDHDLHNDKFDGIVSDVAVPYLHKYALFPLFKCIATGRMGAIYQKMLDEKVDNLLMTSAVKVGSQGAVKFNGETIDQPFNVYTSQFVFLRRQLNTDPEEGESANLGTQMVKIVMQNLRLDRQNYIDSKTGKQKSGQELLEDYMSAINKLEKIGLKELNDKFFTDEKLDNKKLCNYLRSQVSSRNTNKCLLEALTIDKDGKLSIPLAATSDASWLESILISTINKYIVKIPTPGNSFVQRSIFAMEGSKTEGGKIKGVSIYNGKKLQMINNDNSMDAVISIDYFDYILPKRPMSFEEKRQWLIDNGIIGEHAKANTIGYRIPTQAQSSIHALRFVDVISTVKSTILLPEEFTKITGSDFDIDHLYLASLNYQTLEDGNVKEITEGDSKQRYQNDLLYDMLTLLKDVENSINSLYKSIDNDTTLPKSITDKIPETENVKQTAYNFGTLHEQTDRRLDYVTGKTGIGPFALNVTAHVLGYLFGVKFRESKFCRETGIFRLDKLVDGEYNSIYSWLSAFINAHVDIVKDPWISKGGVNQFTYNMVNLLTRSGFGESTMWFVAQPIIKDMAIASTNAQSQFAINTFKYKTVYAAQQDAITQSVLKYLDKEDISEATINTYTTDTDQTAIGLRINAVNFIKNHSDVLEAIATHPGAETVTVNNIKYNVKDVQKTVFYAWKSLEKYAMALASLVKYTKIDTSKEGKTFLEMYDYYKGYLNLINGKDSLFDKDSLSNLVNNSWIDSKTKDACTYPFKILYNQMFNANKQFIDNLVIPISEIFGDQIDLVNEVSKSLSTQIKSKYIIKYAHQELKMSDDDISGLFVGPMCMNHRFNMLWNAIRTNPKYERLKNNKLLTSLYSVIEESSIYVDGVEYQKPAFLSISDNVEDDRLNGDLMSDAWEDLLRDEDKFVRRFAQHLIVYSYLTSGEYKGWNRLFKYVPAAWLKGEISTQTNIESFATYINNQLQNESFLNNELSSYVDEIVKNHFTDYQFVKPAFLKDKDGNDNFLSINDAVCIGAGIKDDSAPYYISVKRQGSSGKNASDYTIYKRIYSMKKDNLYYPLYVKCPKKGYTSADGKFKIYEYGWQFNYVENTNGNLTSFDIDSAIAKLQNYLDTNPNALLALNTATGISSLSSILNKIYYTGEIEDISFQPQMNPQTQSTPTKTDDFTGEAAERFGTLQQQQSVLNSDKTILTNAEILALSPFTRNDNRPRIAVATEHTDPVFFSKMIKDWSEGKHTFNDRKGNPINFNDIDALYIITKHDGLPMRDILQIKKPKIVHFSVTTLGGTKWEPGVMKWQDMIERIGDFIKQGLDTEYLTLRIDPIVPGVTDAKEVEALIKRASELGVKHIRFSVLDYYMSTAKFMENAGYDYSQYYEKDQFGYYQRHARADVIKQIAEKMLSITKKYNVDLSTCAEPCRIDGISIEGCLSVNAINKMLGTHIIDRSTDNNKFRPECTCYGGKTDLLQYNKKCASSCLYCYAHHNGDKILNYYNEDGTLKQNRFTDSGLNKSTNNQSSINLGFDSIDEVIMNSGGAYGADTAWDYYARKAGVKQINHYRDQGNQVLSSSLNKRGIKAVVLSKEQMEYARRREFELLGKHYDDTLQGNLQVRNFYQVASSDGVFAIAFMNSTKNGVSGGTNTAVQLGISLNKPTHVFDLNSEKWYKYNPESKVFEEESTPVLTKSFAGIGTRDIQNYNVYKDGKWVTREQYVGDDKAKVALKAIEDVFNKTQAELSNYKSTTSQNVDKLPKNYQAAIDQIQKHFDIDYTTRRLGENAAKTAIQKLNITIDENSYLFDTMQKHNLSGKDLLNALYILSSYIDKSIGIEKRITLSSKQIDDILDEMDVKNVESDILGETGGIYGIQQLDDDSLIADETLIQDLNFLFQNNKYAPIYDALLNQTDEDNNDIIDILNVDHADLSSLIHIDSTFDNTNQLELFSEEDMKKAKEIKNHCKGGN